jgi:serine/threonine protein kinase
MLDDEMLDLLTKLLKFDPERRPTAAECLLHSYFASLSSDSLDSHRTCVGLTYELVDQELQKFVEQFCGGL